MKNLLRLNKYFIIYKWHLLFGIAFVAATNYCKVRIPQIIRDGLNFVFDTIEQSGDVNDPSIGQALMKFSLTILVVAVVMGVTLYFCRQTLIVMSRLVEYDLRKALYSKYQVLDRQFFKQYRTGDLMSRISEDVAKVRMYLGPCLLYGLNLVALFIISISAMIQVSPKLTLYTLLPLPILSFSIYKISSIINKKSELIQKQIAKLNSTCQEIFSGIRIVKAYVKEGYFAGYFDTETEDFRSKSLDLAKVNALFFPMMILLISLSSLLTIFIGGIMVNRGEISPGNIAEFIIYVNYLTWPFTSIGWIASLIQQAEVSQKRMNEILDYEPSIINKNQDDYSVKGDIEFKNISFTYPETGVKAVSELDFSIKAGEKLLIVGKTASGKSSIMDLIMRMYDPTEGQILIDGKDSRDHNLSVLRSSIAYIPQDVFLFSDTIYNNINFGIDAKDLSTTKSFASHASIDNEIESLPKSYETLVGERGVTLSGGQKQRVSIARAFIRESDIILMDDCLSAVDTKTEKKILSYLNDALRDKTAIIITHRLFDLNGIDKIMIIEEGRCVAMGNHDQLFKNNSFYREMVERQLYENVE